VPRPWLFGLAALGALSATAGTLYWQRVLRPRESPSAATSDAGTPTTPAATAPAAVPQQDSVQAALAGNALLTPEAARALAGAWRQRGLATDDLSETALLMAIKGFGTLPAAKADALRSSFDRLYSVLPGADRAETERLLGQIREGRAQPEDLARAVTLMDSGVQKLDAATRQRFQDQYSAAVLVAIAMRDESDRIAAAGPPTYAAAIPAVAAGPPVASAEPAVLPGTGYPGALYGASGGSAGGAASVRRPGNDSDEAYWRNRANQLRAAVERAEAAVRAAETDLRGAMLRDYQPACPGLPPVLTSEAIRNWKCQLSGLVPAARAKLEAAQASLERAKRQLEGLDDEARRAGALPGWIR